MKMWFCGTNSPLQQSQTESRLQQAAETVYVGVCALSEHGSSYPRCPDIKSYSLTHTQPHKLIADFVLIYIDPWLCWGPVIKLTHQQRKWWLHQTTACMCVWRKEGQRKCTHNTPSSLSLEEGVGSRMTSRPESSARFSAWGLWEKPSDWSPMGESSISPTHSSSL